ncbi:hypothetical protein LB518_13685 [Mesorhizobium sp. BR1-1-16]|uniref:hypothetical protein n=1 Tax=Mesorhizobium sp. BR1-1-16 TaxID=2876653 RepID=UPI001CCB037E|nr:hypothetical protein [Mesorhizobium sp. BR1-1-16]MBZ9937351.1 hypothetical protein [Mesorhizobium sp. BR1-1-16]
MPLRVDLSIWRGNNGPALIWTLPDEVPLADSAFFLTVAAAGTLLLARDTTSGTLVLDAEARQLRLDYTTAESRLIPPGQIAEYEIERRNAGLEITELYGFLAGLGGLNADEDASNGVQLDFSNPDNSNLQLLGWI